MKWAVVNEIGNIEKRQETTIVEAENATTAMSKEFSEKVFELMSNEKDSFDEETATIAVYEVIVDDEGREHQGNFNHLIEISKRGNLASGMQKLLDEEKAKNEKYLLFDEEIFHKPSAEFQKKWGIQDLELSLTEDGDIRTYAISRYASADCINWGLGMSDDDSEDDYDDEL